LILKWISLTGRAILQAIFVETGRGSVRIDVILNIQERQIRKADRLVLVPGPDMKSMIVIFLDLGHDILINSKTGLAACH
jgi:hypothetical protein